MNETTKRALEYLSDGWSVLPVRPMEKRPYMNNWQKYMREAPSHDDLCKWFESLNGAGVGAVTGSVSGIVVLDVDTRYQGKIEDVLKKHPTHRVASSGGGGFHLYYKYPRDAGRIRNAVDVEPGLDIRADGGFIILPPTVHPSGTQYTWVEYGDMGDLPREFYPTETQGQHGDPNSTWLSDLLRGVGEGSRNDAAAKLSGYLFSKGVNDDVLWWMLKEWNSHNMPPMPMEELATTVKSVKRSHTSKVTQGLISAELVDSPPSKTAPSSGFPLVTLGEYFNKYGREGVTWLVDDWLPVNSIAFLVSPPESYKTWLLLDLAVSVASGMPFLGTFAVNNTGPVLLIQQEDSHGGLAERLSVIIQSRLNLHMGNTGDGLDNGGVEMPALPNIPIYIHPERMLKFNDAKVMEELEKSIDRIRPSVVLIDPLYTTVSTDNYMASAAGEMLRLKEFRDKYGCTFVIAHHSKKNTNPDSTSREDAWGSQFLNAFLESGWQIRRSEKLAENEIVVRRHSKTMGNMSPVVLKFDISTQGPFKYEVAVGDYAATSTNVSGSPNEIVLMLSAANKPMSQSEISFHLKVNKSTVSRSIQKLKSIGAIKVMPDGKITNVERDIEL